MTPPNCVRGCSGYPLWFGALALLVGRGNIRSPRTRIQGHAAKRSDNSERPDPNPNVGRRWGNAHPTHSLTINSKATSGTCFVFALLILAITCTLMNIPVCFITTHAHTPAQAPLWLSGHSTSTICHLPFAICRFTFYINHFPHSCAGTSMAIETVASFYPILLPPLTPRTFLIIFIFSKHKNG